MLRKMSVRSTTAIGLKIKDTDKEFLNLKVDASMSDSFSKISLRDRVFILWIIKTLILEVLLKVKKKIGRAHV